MSETKITPRFKTKYAEVVVPALQEEFKYQNVMQTPKFVKVVVNMGVGEAARDAKLMDGAIRDLTRYYRSEAGCNPCQEIHRTVQTA